MHTLVFPEHAMTTKKKKTAILVFHDGGGGGGGRCSWLDLHTKKQIFNRLNDTKQKKNRNAVNLHLFQFRLSVAFLHNFLPVSADPVWAIITDSRCCEKIKVWIFMIYLWCLASRRPSHSPETVLQSQTNQLNAWLWLIFVWRLDVC